MFACIDEANSRRISCEELSYAQIDVIQNEGCEVRLGVVARFGTVKIVLEKIRCLTENKLCNIISQDIYNQERHGAIHSSGALRSQLQLHKVLRAILRAYPTL